ncbi:MAG: sugar transferase [Phycisphaeraceae bacterium]
MSDPLPNRPIYRFFKRVLDLILSGFATLIFLPFGLVIAVILRFSGEGEIFYRQTRMGRGLVKIGLFKFVTMRKDSEKTGTITMQGDPRVLPVGKFLRKSKLNEVPQLLNILLGDISVIGWRPLTPEVFNYYPPQVQQKLGQIKPGMTGIGSIVFRDEESLLAGVAKPDVPDFYRAHITPYKGELECWYAEHASFLLDIKLILLTAWVVLFSESRLYERLLRDLPKPPEPLVKRRAQIAAGKTSPSN